MNQSYQLYNLIFHIMQDTEYTPKWNYQKEPFLEAEGLHDIPFRHCLFSGISSSALKQLFEAFEEKQRHNIHGLLVVHKGRCIFEKYAAPYRKQYRHVSYSMCKSVVSMAVGLAIDDKKLSLDTRVCDLFPEYLPQKKSKELKELTVYHLLTMEAGVCFSELSQAFSTDWVKSYLRADFMFAPGEGFYYNSLNSYILCAALQKVYGESVMALLHRRIFTPLNIYDITWDTCPRGIEKGGFGMKLSLHDMAKLGLLYMNRGVWYGTSHKKAQRLLSEAYVTAATKKQAATDNKGFDYGFHCWVMEDGFLFNGMLGQNVYVFPKQELIIATQSGSESFLPTTEMMAEIRRFVYGCRVGEKFRAGQKRPAVDKENQCGRKMADEKTEPGGADDSERREFMENY
ncbi:MAG: beta-lactamase family protein, partial [Lachnospiraceae bacterium]|nr:beta-lactamase family protein [Lachnospiraceae bacterium]